ncbi:MAG: hypothetical protein ACOCZ6_02750 [Nanoarchaeota archaeon]
MVEKLSENMKKKGWSERELEHLKEELSKTKKRDYLRKKTLNRFFYWQTLIVIVLLNFAAVLILSPFILIMEGHWIHIITSIIALSIGFMLNFLVTTIDHLELKHHHASLAVIPLLVVIDLAIFFKIFNFTGEYFDIQPDVNIVFFSLLFAICFILPYIYTAAKGKFQK